MNILRIIYNIFFGRQEKEENIKKPYDYGVNNGDEDRYCSEHNGL